MFSPLPSSDLLTSFSHPNQCAPDMERISGVTQRPATTRMDIVVHMKATKVERTIGCGKTSRNILLPEVLWPSAANCEIWFVLGQRHLRLESRGGSGAVVVA